MTQDAEDRGAQDYRHCEALVRGGDYDRWLVAVFAPAEKRPHLHALHAFNLEIARVSEIVSDPRLGEIRLQWWRDALEADRAEATAHPVADALRRTRERFRLPVEPFLALIEARVFDLWNDPAPDIAWLEGYCSETASSLVRLATLILADGADPGGADAAGRAGLAWAMTGLLRALPWTSRRGRVYVPTDLLARRSAGADDILALRSTPAVRAALADLRACARAHLAQARLSLGEADPIAKPAFGMLALIEPYLRRMEGSGYDPFTTEIDLPSWRKVATVWLATWR